MFGSERPDGTAARARLQAVIPRWVPSADDVNGAASDITPVVRAGEPAERQPPRHGLPERPPAAWRLDGGTLRGLVSLALAATVGGLVMVIVGWPRGAEVPGEPSPLAVDSATTEENVLVQPSAPPMAVGAVVVDVDGAVHRPGVVELPEGSRVVDALKSAGGVRAKADTGVLNLAQVLIDGEQITVPRKGAGPSTTVPASPGSPGAGAPSPGALVNLNTATAVELEALPGIGPVLAAAIVDWRTQNGGFTSVDQLEQVSGIGPATFADIAPLVRV